MVIHLVVNRRSGQHSRELLVRQHTAGRVHQRQNRRDRLVRENVDQSVKSVSVAHLTTIGMLLPVDYAAVRLVVRFRVTPVVADLVRHGVVVQFDTQARTRGKVQVSLANRERLLDVPFA